MIGMPTNERGNENLHLEWRFRVRVHSVNRDAPEGDYPCIVQLVGEAPEQYGTWEDEDAEDGKLTDIDLLGACKSHRSPVRARRPAARSCRHRGAG